MRLLIIFSILFVGYHSYTVNYEGYKVFEIIPQSRSQQLVIDLLHSDSSLDFWSESRMLNFTTTIMVKPSMVNDFKSIMILNNIHHREIISNVARTLNDNYSFQILPRSGEITHTAYHRYDTITAYIRKLAATYPTRVSLFDIGKSTEGRDILGIKISNGGINNPAILVDAAIHAREWIAPATILYLIEQLVENPSNVYLSQNVDWYIIPILNPDGYEYTHTKDRLWRKTRSQGSICDGVDANRNFDYHWNEKGSSSNECSATYAGPKAFSEPEAEGLRQFALSNKASIKLYLTIHSCGQYILYPWGYTCDDPNDIDELEILGKAVNEAIQGVAGTRYTVGTSCQALYVNSGGSDDWMKGVAGVELSYTLELPCGGASGFDPPASRILGVAKETFEGFKVFERYVARKWAL